MLFGLTPEQFDILGALAFLAIAVIGLAGLLQDKPLPKWVFGALLLIGIVDLSWMFS
jgi:uncharacterized membrane protein